MSKTEGKNKYLGKLKENDFVPIKAEFTVDNLLNIINEMVSKTSQYSDQQFAHWAESFSTKHIAVNSIERNHKLAKAVEIAEDIYMQWELYLVNKYSLQELQQLDLSKVKLPNEWYKKWQLKLVA